MRFHWSGSKLEGVTARARLNRSVESILRSRAHGLLSRRVLLLTCTGRRSGRRITVPLEYRDADGALLVRSRPHRRWWRNLRGGVPVTVHLRGVELGALAVVDESRAHDGLVEVLLRVASTEGQAWRRASQGPAPNALPRGAPAAARIDARAPAGLVYLGRGG